jgi:hypothetical protein
MATGGLFRAECLSSKKNSSGGEDARTALFRVPSFLRVAW